MYYLIGSVDNVSNCSVLLLSIWVGFELVILLLLSYTPEYTPSPGCSH
jgi:hypothetical protein